MSQDDPDSRAPRTVSMQHLYATQTPQQRATSRTLLGKSGRLHPPSSSLLPPPPPHLKPSAGHRTPRQAPLTLTDLYIGGRLPTHLSAQRLSQRCSLCHSVKVHPVSYLCGHSHCYACIRMHLEESWKCPLCDTILQSPPHRHMAEEEALFEDYPDFVRSTAVTYSWAGLFFPRNIL
ncbi:hypothetical protein C8R46DRAFT_1221062 [Mycena filopes]|nr:hypothetical protein C8R46DRAFT_1235451 [Mycena filopes]KAJ7163643.1 hypothetical protein C8R46DRAFT_1221062 [Mycena filopes]